MKEKTFNLKGGVLIIGSLLWQDHLNKVGDDIRKTWRHDHLLIDKRIMVKVPIRYGRLSSNSFYTMTFSKTVRRNKFGTGYFIPFKKINLVSKEDIIQEAIALSGAEGMKEEFLADWGAVLGILFNDKKVDKEIKKVLTELWRDKITANNKFNHETFKINKSEIPCIKGNGLMNFNWVKPVDSRQENIINSYDFLIATVTKPTNYPRLITLLENVKNDKERFYFIENFKNGITTFQDNTLLNLLS